MKYPKLAIIVFLTCFSYFVNAQVYNTEILFYVRENVDLSNPQESVEILQFRGGVGYRVYRGNEATLKAVHDNLKANSNYYENHKDLWCPNAINLSKYDSKMSNVKWNVYSNVFDRLVNYLGVEEWPAHTQYHAFSKDLLKYILWSEPEYTGQNGQRIGNPFTRKRLTKSEILKLSFIGARSFLN